VNVTVDDQGHSYLFISASDNASLPLQLIFRNCIFRGFDSPISINEGASLTVDHCLFFFTEQPNQILIHGSNTYGSNTLSSLGTWNLYADPRFIAPASGTASDYHLHANSPAINLGTITNASLDDLERHPRDLHPDAGTYECVGCGVPAITGITLQTNGIQLNTSTLADRQYGVKQASAIVGPWEEIGTFLGTGNSMSFIDQTPVTPLGFYRIELKSQ
jgi:hypothetical protein